MDPPFVIGLDVGGTKILSGLVDRTGRAHAEREIPTPDTSEEGLLRTLDEAVEELLDERVVAIGYGIPASLERGTGHVLRAMNLPLDDVDLLTRARERFGLPVGVENDGSAATLAEWRLGAGRGASTLIMLTLGTGVGGGVVLARRLFRGWAELGHVVVQEGGPVCSCGGRGHLEALVSGSAADRVARELFGEGADSHGLVERARAGDKKAGAALERIGALLGAAIGSLVNVFDPELTVVGGGFGSGAGDLVLEPARRAARAEAIAPAREALRIVPAELGPDAGLIGAGLVGFDAFDGVR